MSNLSIVCPNCGKILTIEDKPNINNATLTCPVCQGKAKVGDCKRINLVRKPTSEETQYNNGYSNSGDETQIGTSSNRRGGDETQFVGMSKTTVGRLQDAFGRNYQLKIGCNTIGRKASSSPANVQIDVDDRYMSRNHAIIEVQNTNNGALHILRNSANKNSSYLNGKLIEESDQLVLNNGDKIKLGFTELTFKI